MVKVLVNLLVLQLLFVTGNSCIATAEGLVDPMRPVHYQTPVTEKSVAGDTLQTTTSDWQLTAVLISAGRTVAVINGKSLQLGARLDGYQLIQIDSDQVVLKNKQKTLTLRRAGTGLKQMSPARDIR